METLNPSGDNTSAETPREDLGEQEDESEISASGSVSTPS